MMAILVVVVFAVTAFAQTGGANGRIIGTVQDQTGAVIPGVTVTVTNQGTGFKFSAVSSSEGAFSVPELPSALYQVSFAVKGFSTRVYQDVKVDAGKATSLTGVLSIGGSSETVEVKANQEVVNTTTSEASKTVNTIQVQNLPLNGRGVIGLLGGQANVTTSGRSNTALAGARPSWSQVTLDGINIQDIFIRTNALDFIPNRPSTETVQEFTVLQGGQGADAALGTNGVKMTVKSGSNTLHGELYEYNRNSAFAANSWFNKHATPEVKIPFLNRNEYGGNVGGPIKKNKLFFFAAFDGLSNHAQSALNEIVPAHADFLQGVYRYQDTTTKTLQAVNIITGQGLVSAPATALSIDPTIQSTFLTKINGASTVNNFNRGDSTSSLLKNTAAFLQNQASNVIRKAETGKIDYEISSRHHIDLTAERVHEVTDRSDIDPINVKPMVTNNAFTQFYSGGWRWTINNTMINSVRIGANRAPAPFNSSYANPDPFLYNSGTSSTSTVSGIGLTGPQVFFQPQGRISTAHQYGDDFNWVKGNHNMQFGGTFIQWNVHSYDYGINPYTAFPIVVTGFSAAAPKSAQLTGSMFPGGISSADLATANNIRAFLAGVVSSASQQFYVADKTSGFTKGQINNRFLTMKDYAFYGTDSWRIKSNLTVNFGLRWEYITPYKDNNGLQLGPVWENPSNPLGTLLDPNATVNFIDPAYNPDRNNFAPSVGFAWDPFKDGKMSIRGSYSIAYVNDDTFRAAGNAADGNAGLSSAVQLTGLYQFLANGVSVPTPTFKMPRTLADQLAVTSTAALFGIDPNVKTPYIHNIYFGVERQIARDTVLSIRYVGTLGRDLLRGLDYNQTNAGVNQPYLTDFLNARNNGYLAAAAGKGYNPNYDATVAGSKPLPFFNTITGLVPNLTNSTIVSLLQQNQAGALADFMYGSNPGFFTNSRNIFLPNPGIYVADLIKNAGTTSYHSGVVELTRRFGSTQIQANYTWSKLLSDTPGDNGQTRFDPLLDNARPRLDKGPSNYDLRHSFKMNAVYQLPVGKGHWLLGSANGVVDRLVSGWTLSGIYNIQSGAPFSILSGRGTFNRSGRSSTQTAVSSMSQSQVMSLFGNFQTANGNVYFINPSVTGSDGRAVGPDNQNNTASTAFNQVFSNPTAGNVGNLGLLAFSGPRYQNLDMRLGKVTKITERIGFELGLDAFNTPNHPIFSIGDQEINSTTFGRITSTKNNPRQLQISGRLTF